MGLNEMNKPGKRRPKEGSAHYLYTAKYVQPTRAGYTRISLLYQTANSNAQSSYANETKTRKQRHGKLEHIPRYKLMQLDS